MSIEADLGRVADALERIVKLVEPGHGAPARTEKAERAEKPAKAEKAEKPAKAEKAEKAEKPAKDKGPDKDVVRAALQRVMATHGREAAIDLLKEHAEGAENLSQLKEKHHAAVIAAVEAAEARAKEDDI